MADDTATPAGAASATTSTPSADASPRASSTTTTDGATPRRQSTGILKITAAHHPAAMKKPGSGSNWGAVRTAVTARKLLPRRHSSDGGGSDKSLSLRSASSRSASSRRLRKSSSRAVKDAHRGASIKSRTNLGFSVRCVLLTLVPIRPRSRGARRSLRTLLPGVSLRSHHAFNLDTPRRL